MQFGGIPIVMVLGDFAQFEPVRGISLIFPQKHYMRTSGNARDQLQEESSAALVNKEN
jgi:hypothetical protein